MCKELAKELRSKLKELGYNRNMVSVTSDYNSIHVKVKSIDVDFKKVEELANNYEEIDRDHVTGEILQGANNTYVSIEYADCLMESLENTYMSKAEEIFEAIQNSNELENIFIKDEIHAFLGDFKMIWFRVPQANGSVKRYKCYNCVSGIAKIFAEIFLNEKIDILETSEPVQEVTEVKQIREESQQVINSINTENLTTQKESLKTVSNQLDIISQAIDKNINNDTIRLQLRDIENDLKWHYSSLDGLIENQTIPNANDFNNIETLKTVYISNWNELPQEIQEYILSCDKYWIDLQEILLYKDNKAIASIGISGHNKNDIEINSIGAGDKGNLFQWNSIEGYTLNNLKIKVTNNEYQEICKAKASLIYAKDETKISYQEYCKILDQYEILPFQTNCNNKQIKSIINKYCNNETKTETRTIYKGHIPDDELIYNLMFKDDYNSIYNESYTSAIMNDSALTIISYCEGDLTVIACDDRDSFNDEAESYKRFYKENLA